MVSGFGAIDLVRTGVNKATGLKDLCERLDADPAGILAFGDGENDMEMLRYAGLGVLPCLMPRRLCEMLLMR